MFFTFPVISVAGDKPQDEVFNINHIVRIGPEADSNYSRLYLSDGIRVMVATPFAKLQLALVKMLPNTPKFS